jgi:hypothetical protein
VPSAGTIPCFLMERFTTVNEAPLKRSTRQAGQRNAASTKLELLSPSAQRRVEIKMELLARITLADQLPGLAGEPSVDIHLRRDLAPRRSVPANSLPGVGGTERLRCR